MRPEDVPGGISLEVGQLLRELASGVEAGQCIVEIGAFKGRSTCFLADGAQPGVEVISIDAHGLLGASHHHTGMYGHPATRAAYLEHVAAYAYVRNVHALSKNAPLPEEPIGLLWIDGDHSYEGAKLDIDKFGPRVVHGGFMVIDDYGARWHAGVIKAVDEARRDPEWVDWKFKPKSLAWTRKRA
jgi:predicted O-methyltransferase YrrM